MPSSWLTRVRCEACSVRTAAGLIPGLAEGTPPLALPGLVGIHR